MEQEPAYLKDSEAVVGAGLNGGNIEDMLLAQTAADLEVADRNRLAENPTLLERFADRDSKIAEIGDKALYDATYKMTLETATAKGVDAVQADRIATVKAEDLTGYQTGRAFSRVQEGIDESWANVVQSGPNAGSVEDASLARVGADAEKTAIDQFAAHPVASFIEAKLGGPADPTEAADRALHNEVYGRVFEQATAKGATPEHAAALAEIQAEDFTDLQKARSSQRL